MSDIEHNGGPAFPQHDLSGYDIGPIYPTGGMTLRDWFAGQALTGMGNWCPVDSEGYAVVGSLVPVKRAEWAYAQADAMLAARSKADAS
jgi:hypothetical protein